MAEFDRIVTLRDLANQDPAEMLSGYRAGLNGDPEPGSDKSRGFWHGWLNGMVDSGRREKDQAQAILAARYSEAARLPVQ